MSAEERLAALYAQLVGLGLPCLVMGGRLGAASSRPSVRSPLPDGRDELLECWRRNHLLPPFPELVATASRGPGHVIAAALLSPWMKGEVKWPEKTAPPILEIGASLATVTPGSARHLALVEAVRRLYRRPAMAADRADKESASPPPAV